MPLFRITPPAIEPVSLADMYNQSRIIDHFDDSLLQVYIPAARAYAENYCRRSFITQQWRLVLDSFPGRQMGGYASYGETYSMPDNAVLLERGDVQSVDSITYIAMDGSTQTANPPDYIAEISGNPARVAPAFGKIWPISLPQIGAVKVNFTAGYGVTAASVPEGIRHWIQMRVATMYENREEVAILLRGKIEPLPFVDSLLDPYVVVTA